MQPVFPRARAITVIVGMALCAAPASATASAPAWTTYHHDTARSGIDPDSTSPLVPTQAWQTPALDGKIWAEPLVYGSRVYVATENDTVYALDAATGSVVWQSHVATAVPSSKLPCGNIGPLVGITSTPVIDPATNRIYVVGDTWNGSSVAHQMVGLNLSDGSLAVGPVAVDPPGSSPAAQLQRASLALDAGKIIIGYGGNDGDCGTYHGWLVAVPESGGGLQSFEADAAGNGGAIWGSGNAPAVDGNGDIWVSTGNNTGTSTFDHQESVLRLDANLNLRDFWAPSNWSSLDSSDTDLGSTVPLLLPDGLVFELGKEGTGYLLSQSNLGGEGGPPVYQAQVCSGSWGGGIYVSGVIYVACSDGMYALQLDAAGGRFTPTPIWTSGDGISPPVYAGGLIWSADYNNGTLYGLDPGTGATKFSANLNQFEHFTTPSAGGGRLFVANRDPSVATADEVTAFAIATPPPGTTPAGSGATPAGSGATAAGSRATPNPPSGGSAPAISHLRVRIVHQRLRLSLRLSGPTRLIVLVSRLVPGRMVHRRCQIGVKHGRSCRKAIPTARFRWVGRTGNNSFKPGRVLAPGRYAVTVTAVDSSGRRSKPQRLVVIVVRPRRR